MRKIIKSIFILIFLLMLITTGTKTVKADENTDFIKWVDFNASYSIMQKVYDVDQKIYNEKGTKQFCEILAVIALKNGNKFNISADSKTLNEIASMLIRDENPFAKYEQNKYYKYYLESYHAVFDGIIGEYKLGESNETKYGLRGYHPIARGFYYSGGDDFGNSRNFGFKRRHLGHDMFGNIGTPIISVEDGIITELGWNRYGGWRVGVRSHDTKRYYYYAHLKKDKPFATDLKIGDNVKAGDVIGFLGVTGYSYKENVNMKAKPHLHFGLQLIFDESQEDGNGEIWIDVYQLSRLLAKHRAPVNKDNEQKEYKSTPAISWVS